LSTDSCLVQRPAGVTLFVTQGVGDTTEIIAMILLPVAVLMCAYALVVFLWRSSQIARKQVRVWRWQIQPHNSHNSTMLVWLSGVITAHSQCVAWTVNSTPAEMPDNPASQWACCRSRQVGYIDDQNGPLCLAVVVVLALSGIFIVSTVDFVQQLRSHTWLQKLLGVFAVDVFIALLLVAHGGLD
jgi:hypothetical protein